MAPLGHLHHPRRGATPRQDLPRSLLALHLGHVAVTSTAIQRRALVQMLACPCIHPPHMICAWRGGYSTVQAGGRLLGESSVYSAILLRHNNKSQWAYRLDTCNPSLIASPRAANGAERHRSHCSSIGSTPVMYIGSTPFVPTNNVYLTLYEISLLFVTKRSQAAQYMSITSSSERSMNLVPDVGVAPEVAYPVALRGPEACAGAVLLVLYCQVEPVTWARVRFTAQY